MIACVHLDHDLAPVLGTEHVGRPDEHLVAVATASRLGKHTEADDVCTVAVPDDAETPHRLPGTQPDEEAMGRFSHIPSKPAAFLFYRIAKGHRDHMGYRFGFLGTRLCDLERRRAIPEVTGVPGRQTHPVLRVSVLRSDRRDELPSRPRSLVTDEQQAVPTLFPAFRHRSRQQGTSHAFASVFGVDDDAGLYLASTLQAGEANKHSILAMEQRRRLKAHRDVQPLVRSAQRRQGLDLVQVSVCQDQRGPLAP